MQGYRLRTDISSACFSNHAQYFDTKIRVLLLIFINFFNKNLLKRIWVNSSLEFIVLIFLKFNLIF